MPLSEIALAFASNVTLNEFALPFATTRIWICCERVLPVPSDWSYVVNVNVSLPGGTCIETVHVHGPEPLHGEPGALPELFVTAVTTLNCDVMLTPAVSAVMLTRTDFVAAEMYCGLRVLLLVDGAGMVILNVAATSSPAGTMPGI